MNMTRHFLAHVLLSAVLSTASASAAVAQTTTPGAAMQKPTIYRFSIGDVQVTALSDGSVPIDMHPLLRGLSTAEVDAMLARSFLTNPTEVSINAFLLEFKGHKVLVDTGVGDLFGPGNAGQLPKALALAGVSLDQVTDILLSHIHADHSGGLVRGGKIMFQNATVHVGKADLDFFLDKSNAKRTGYELHHFVEGTAMLKPYVDAGKVRTIDRSGEILPGITAELHPGHTPGTAFYTLSSRGSKLVFIGDTIHAPAVQFPRPDVTITFDQDQPKARAVRKQAFSEFATGRTLVAAPHLPFPGVGHIARDGTGYRWFPVDFVNRAPATPAATSE
jgi:glyoxylase-like metal-dependent hydrolase (beta-lactamase superfamily II)